jgi:hypothetical protein
MRFEHPEQQHSPTQHTLDTRAVAAVSLEPLDNPPY